MSNIIKSFIVMFFGNVFGQLLFFLAFTYLARVLGPEKFGIWNYAQVWMLFSIRASEFGLEVVGVREVPRFPNETKKWIAIIISTRFFLSFLVFIIILFFLYIVNISPVDNTSLMLISTITVFPVAFLLEWVLEARQEYGWVSIARILKGFLFFIFTYLLITSEEQVEFAAFLYFLSVLIPSLFIYYIVISRFGFDWPSIRITNGLDALKKSTPMAITILLSHYSLYLPTIVVGHLLPKEELGFFSAAHRIILFLWAYIVTSMQRVLLPTLSQGYLQSEFALMNFVQKFFRIATLILLPIGLVITFSGTFLMEILYSSRYESSGVVFEIIIWGFVFYGIRFIFELVLIVAQKSRQYIKGMLLLAISYSLLTPLLTVYFGIIGTSVAIVTSEFVYLIYLICISIPVNRTIILKFLLKLMFISFSIIMLVKIFIPEITVIQCVIGLLLFIIVLLSSNSEFLQDFRSLSFWGKNV